MRFILFPVIQGTSNGGKALQTGDHHIILTERTVDDEQVSTFISATYDPHMLVTGIEYQITWLGLIPRDRGIVLNRMREAQMHGEPEPDGGYKIRVDDLFDDN